MKSLHNTPKFSISLFTSLIVALVLLPKIDWNVLLALCSQTLCVQTAFSLLQLINLQFFHSTKAIQRWIFVLPILYQRARTPWLWSQLKGSIP
jgi:hypothetical protein